MKHTAKNKNPVLDALLNLFFPRRCVWCDAVVGFGKACGCEKGLQTLALPATPLPLEEQGQLHAYLKEAYACFEYTVPVSSAILRMKFEEDTAAAKPLGAMMAAKAAAAGLVLRYDAVVPVPVSRKTLKKRGYNQALLLARQLGHATGLPVLGGVLEKQRETKQQMRLTREQRLVNVQGAYVAKGQCIVAKRLLLVDDVMTTGATLNECAKALLEAEALTCGALCVACVTNARHTKDTA